MKAFSHPYGATTAQVADMMLKEPVGTNLVDSGGVYGRMWERNVGKDLSVQPKSWGRFDATRNPRTSGPGRLVVQPSVSTYHWISESLLFSGHIQQQFAEFCEQHDVSGLEAADLFGEHLVNTGEASAYKTDYTYNYPDYCHLSQDVHYTVVEMEEGGDLVILSVHGGCDARWGFSEPRCFWAKEDWDTARERMTIDGVGCDHSTWWYEGWNQLEACSQGAVVDDLRDIPAYDLGWVSNETLEETRALLEAAPAAIEMLANTQLGHEAQQRARTHIEHGVERLKRSLWDEAVAQLNSEHETFFLCHDGNAWLFHGDEVQTLKFDAGQRMECFVN